VYFTPQTFSKQLTLVWCRSQMIGPTQPLVAMTGDDIILPCQLEPARDAVDLTVEWSRRDLKPRFVHLKRDDAELVTQNTLYSRRTSLSVNKLKCGDISLKLSKVQVSDAGTYSCLVPEIGAKSGMELVIGNQNEIFFKCKSNGWYPEPRVFWLNSQGKQITAESTNSAKGSDGLYTVSSTVTVNKRQTYSLTCRVQQKNINQTEEAHIHVSGRKNTCLSRGRILLQATVYICELISGTVLLNCSTSNSSCTNPTLIYRTPLIKVPPLLSVKVSAVVIKLFCVTLETLVVDIVDIEVQVHKTKSPECRSAL
uniref:Ig-like domain-containing protein n=1 Tax=Maylandia zebra TaxID=106582 RepID=A0A3P9DSS3_9CICH